MDELSKKHCVPCEGNSPPLSEIAVKAMLKQVLGWQVNEKGTEISRTFVFGDFAAAMSFANAIAKVADEENHHPDLHVSWGRLEVQLTTHAIRGLSENDFVLASKINSLTQNNIVI